MPYSAPIQRKNPTLLTFLIDQSFSMSQPVRGHKGQSKPKSRFLSEAINDILEEIVLKCARDNGEVRDYIFVNIIGYGEEVKYVLNENGNEDVVSISWIANNPSRIEIREKDGVSMETPIWFDPIAEGQTPMCAAFGAAKKTIENWVVSHPNSFPPIIINITDGQATDGDPTSIAKEIEQIETTDGKALLFNAHIADMEDSQKPVVFPLQENELPQDAFGRMLFRISSALPPSMLPQAQKLGYKVVAGSRGFMFHAGTSHLIHLLDIGTRYDITPGQE